jgi:glycosyltransferase involved in cell wall biosynthesis
MLDFVEPIWLYNLDANPQLEAGSWRMSFRAALVRVSLLRHLGSIDRGFDTLAGASLDTGLRLFRAGAFMRQVSFIPNPGVEGLTDPPPSRHDELRFIWKHYGPRWVAWASGRHILTGGSAMHLPASIKRLRKSKPPPERELYVRPAIQTPREGTPLRGSVSVLAPTLDRYSYLSRELEQLRAQTVKPIQIIITDQTPQERRNSSFLNDFHDLPIVYIPQDTRGQSSAWNAALQASTGDHILFLGDDADAIPEDFIERLLASMNQVGADMVGAYVIEAGGEAVKDSAGSIRMGDTFPIALVKRTIIERCGLYDLAFDRGARADADMAVRWHLAGAILAYDPTIRIVHLKAPVGGLRAQKARIVTTFSSRRRLLHRDIPSVTELYFVLKHYPRRCCRELIWQKTAATLIADGPLWRKIAKACLGAVLVPHTVYAVAKNRKAAERMFRFFPQTPSLATTDSAGVTETPLSKNPAIVSSLYCGDRLSRDGRIHVVHIIDRLHLGGAERMAVEIASALDQKLYRVSICISRSGNLIQSSIASHVKVFELGRRHKWDLIPLISLSRFSRKQRVDVIHTHGIGSFRLATLAKLFGLRGTILLHDHEVPAGDKVLTSKGVPRSRMTYALIFRVLRPWYVAVDENVLRWSIRAGASAARSIVIHNAIDLRPHVRGGAERSRREHSGTDQIHQPQRGVCVATVRPAKNLETLIRAVSLLGDKLSAIEIVGAKADTEYLLRCEELIRQFGLEGRLVFSGPRPDIPFVLRRADFGVISSSFESGPLVLIEYMASELPFVATRTGLNARLAERFGAEEFVEPGDALALANALDRLLVLSPSARRERVKIARQIAEEHFDIAAQIARWERLYQSVSG